MNYFKLVYLFLFIIDFVYGFSLCKFSFSPSLQRICERLEENYLKENEKHTNQSENFFLSLVPPGPIFPAYVKAYENQTVAETKLEELRKNNITDDWLKPKELYNITKEIKGNFTSDAYKCKTLVCLCPYFKGTVDNITKKCILSSGKPLQKAIRKEYRLLTDEERHRYHKALRTLMDNGIFDEISVIHVHVAQDDLVHGKPKFWMWHRGYLKRFEIELRKLDIDLAIPYWDTTLDDNLPFPADSLMWTNDFMGAVDENGTVISGPGANWLTLNEEPLKRRNYWKEQIGRLLNENDIKMLLKMTQVNVPRMKHDRFKYKFSCAQQLNFLELMHASAHHFIGGDMSDLQAASNDPIFLQFHCFIDLIWEIFRQQKDTDCHIRGLIDNDIDETFSYESRPSCTYENPDCSSKYLFCDQHGSEAKCASKIRLNGNCTGLNNEDVPCLEGKCIHDKCLLLNNQTSSLLEDFKLLDFAIHLKRDMGDSMVLDEK